jgi:hypothetical protein
MKLDAYFLIANVIGYIDVWGFQVGNSLYLDQIDICTKAFGLTKVKLRQAPHVHSARLSSPGLIDTVQNANVFRIGIVAV